MMTSSPSPGISRSVREKVSTGSYPNRGFCGYCSRHIVSYLIKSTASLAISSDTSKFLGKNNSKNPRAHGVVGLCRNSRSIQ
jgi:hypothetical protein